MVYLALVEPDWTVIPYLAVDKLCIWQFNIHQSTSHQNTTINSIVVSKYYHSMLFVYNIMCVGVAAM